MCFIKKLILELCCQKSQLTYQFSVKDNYRSPCYYLKIYITVIQDKNYPLFKLADKLSAFDTHLIWAWIMSF